MNELQHIPFMMQVLGYPLSFTSVNMDSGSSVVFILFCCSCAITVSLSVLVQLAVQFVIT